MKFSIKTKVVFPLLLMTLIMSSLVGFAWYALNETTHLNASLANRFDEIEEVRKIELLFSNLIYPHLEYITNGSSEASKQAHQIIHEAEHIVDDLNAMTSVTKEERNLTLLLANEIKNIELLSEKILHTDASTALKFHQMYFEKGPAGDTHYIHERENNSFSASATHEHKNESSPTGVTHEPNDILKLLNKISREHIANVRNVLAAWHLNEARNVDELAEETQVQLQLFSGWVLAFAGLLVSVVIFAMWLNNRVLIRPVISLSRSTNQLATGDLTQRAEVYSEDELGSLARTINQMAASLDSLYGQMAAMARTDQLTGLVNRHGLMDILTRECGSAKRYGSALSVLMIDIDHFKQINDNYGHTVGDIVIRVIADVCREVFRNIDFSIRYGGEEFMIIMPQTPVKKAMIAAERYRSAIACRNIKVEGHNLKVTVSIGVARFDNADAADNMVIIHADQALYEAKQDGRNLVKCYNCDPMPGQETVKPE